MQKKLIKSNGGKTELGGRVLSSLFSLFMRTFMFFVIAGTSLLAQHSDKPVPNQEAVQIENEAQRLATIWNEGSYRQSQNLYETAAKKWFIIGNLQKYAACLRKTAKLKLSFNETNEAWQLFSDALRAEQKAGNTDGEAETLSYLTLIAARNNKIETSRRFLEMAFVLSEKNRKPEIMAKVAFAAAEFHYRNQRNLPLMTESLKKAVRLFREAEDKIGEVLTLTEMAYTFVMDNDRTKGQEYANEAVKIARESGDSRILAFALIAQGDAFERVGNWNDAYQSFKEAESIFPDNLDFFEKAILFDRFGVYHETFGNLIQARTYYQKARELFIKIGNLYGSSELATVIGQICRQLGEEQQALKYFNEGLEVSLKSKDKYSLAYAYENIGEVYFSKHDFDTAFSYYQKALENFEKVGIKHAVASVKEKLGKLYVQQNNNKLAKSYFTDALEINKKIRSKVGEAGNLYNLALLYQSENQIESGLSKITESLLITDFLHSETANKQLKKSFLSNMFDRYELYINLLMKMNNRLPNENHAIQALQVAEKSRARSMLEMLSLAEVNFTKDADLETVKREKEIRSMLNLKADKLTDLLSQNADKAETEKIGNEINELELELEEIKAKLKQQSPIYSAIKNPAPFDVAEFQNQVLDENSLLLEFSFGKEESYLWLVGKTEVNSYVLPPREQIEAKIQKLREILASRQMIKGEEIEVYQARIIKAENDYWQTAKELSNELFGQVADKFEQKRLIVVPDGKLNYFPVSALPLPNSETGEPILLSNEVVYEPSASTLSILAKSQNQTSGATKNLLVFSDPVFTKEDSRISTQNRAENSNAETASPESFRFVESLNSLPRLTASKTEADSIIDILGRSSADNYTGFAANREQLLNANAADYKILHFATHGLIDEQRPELSGIVLSRFAENGQKMDEFVRLHDIYGMNLNSDLVVLSACETGIGKEVRGEGLQSLNNAFLQVGAKSVMSSLWKVEDNATLELMKNFYQALANEKVTPSKALQQAQIKMWQSGRYKSPFYWAAFTVQGDFRRVPEISGDFPYATAFLAAGLAVLVFGIFWLYGRKRGKLLHRK